MRTIKYLILLIVILQSSLVMAETRQNTKIWGSAIIVGPLSSDHKIEYYLQPQLNFVDDKYKFHAAFLYVGVGYHPTTNVTYWLMNGYNIDKQFNGDVRHVDIIRQQINANLMTTEVLNLLSTSRLEERKNFDESQWSLLMRQMLTVRLPIPSWECHSLVLFDEIFINLNHPDWINSSSFVSQNRAFIGIGTQMSPTISIDVGYMNQYQFKHIDANNNVLYLLLNVAG